MNCGEIKWDSLWVNLTECMASHAKLDTLEEMIIFNKDVQMQFVFYLTDTRAKIE